VKDYSPQWMLNALIADRIQYAFLRMIAKMMLVKICQSGHVRTVMIKYKAKGGIRKDSEGSN
jgi:hypothetical protein